jgi:quercetin dioxygenase-like cupin family protein
MPEDPAGIAPPPSKRLTQEWGTMEWLLEDALVPGAGMSVAVMTLGKGKTSPSHRHPNCHEFVFMVRGRVEVTLDGKKTLLEKGDRVLIRRGTVHGMENRGGGEARMLISYSEGTRVYEEVPLSSR